MLNALLRAIEALCSPPLRRLVVLSLAIAIASFIVLWIGVALVLQHLPTIGWRPLDWLIDLLGVVGVLLLSWLLFPALVTLVMGFFLSASRRQSSNATIPTVGHRAANRSARPW